jgi:hypothetical protein
MKGHIKVFWKFQRIFSSGDNGDKMDRASIFGNYRAKVVDNRDKQMFGRVLIWIPDIMPEVSEDQGIWARPANNPLGGRNMENDSSHHYMGTSYIPKKGAWVFVFFEGGNINRPYYFGALDLENTKVLPENQVGSNYEDKWTIFKSHAGRAIVVSDDSDDARVEITGKKRLLTNPPEGYDTKPPTGDTFSVYRIDENQNTILLDERSDTEKLLIKTHKGDFIKLSIKDRTLEIQVADNIEIRSGGHILVTSSGDQHFLAGGNFYITAGANINMVAGGSINQEAGDEYNYKCASNSNQLIGAKKVVQVGEESYQSVATEHHIQAGTLIARDAANIKDNSGASQPAPPTVINAVPATTADPTGDRDEP